MREGLIQDWAVRKAREAGVWARKFRTENRRSAPDYIFGHKGEVWWVEFKATGEKPTELQQQEIDEMRAHGLTVYVCDSREQAAEILSWMLAAP